MSVSQIISDRSTSVTPTPLYGWLTVERGLYGLFLLIAAGLRLGWLGTQPLNAVEAGHAWSAWLVATGNGAAPAPAPDSPLLYALYTLLFWALGANDITARFVPALCGVAFVALLWYWRDWLGRLPALLAAFLIAVDPWLTAYSRLADSTMLSIFLAMLTLTGLMQLALQGEETISSSWRTTTAVSFGLLLVSGPQLWGLLVVLVLFCWLCLSLAHLQGWLRQPTVWALVAGAAVVGATGWLARPEGLGAISTSLTVWLSQITGAGATVDYSVGWLLGRFLVDQPLVLLLGLIGLGAAWRTQAVTVAPEEQKGLRFLIAWFLWGVLLVSLPGRSPYVMVMVSLPLLLLAAYGLQLLLQETRNGVAWRENSLLAAVLTILLISFAFWLAALTNNVTFDGLLARTLLIILVLIFLITLAYTFWLDGRQARFTTGTLLALLLLAWTISSNWQLNQRFDLAYPDGFFAAYTNPDVRRLAADVQMLSAQRRGDAGEMPVQVEMTGQEPFGRDPVLGWYLREMRNLQWVLAPGMVDGQSPPVIITLSADSTVDQLASSYLGSRYALRDHWLPTILTANEAPAPLITEEMGFGARLQERLNTLWTARWRALLRWSIYREAPAIPPSDGVILWVVADENL